ncbi:hypothetical protein [Agromyces sp. Leaf222]|uniref:hypothetical protein n=1 Tax=Agromyces sp. Leaf222 TaxID=1735688 RepID=UPI0006FE3154|nr:hypothetical protein [Agromyces sp. Leaf222]KQM82818.1 hypothetical protein ASE68_05715 [Agromyces sp. Leaf222]
MTSTRGRARDWLARYLPLEVCGTLAAMLGAWLAFDASGSLAVAALAGSLAESVGYYGIVVVRAARGHAASARVQRLGGVRAMLATTWLTLRSVAVEFGPAELVDSVLVRPALLWAASAAWGANPGAWLAGKLAADAVFYAIAIVSFELGRRVILPSAEHDVEHDTGRDAEHDAAPSPAPLPRPIDRPLTTGARS